MNGRDVSGKVSIAHLSGTSADAQGKKFPVIIPDRSNRRPSDSIRAINQSGLRVCPSFYHFHERRMAGPWDVLLLKKDLVAGPNRDVSDWDICYSDTLDGGG